MAVKVLLPAVFRRFVNKQESIEIEAKTVGELLKKLVSEHESLGRVFLNDEGEFLSAINVFVNDENIRALDGYDTALEEGDVVNIVPAIAGGTCQSGLSSW
ncbi:MAG: MoaD family protein [Candidatus Latescibacterota bacterium]|nr:MAG: MoaD family protein [Candidatus Latescibacterota bacterium]